MFATVSHARHRLRRSAINHLFSKQAVAHFEHLIQEKVDELCDRLRLQINEGIVEMQQAYSALTFDIINHYAFGNSVGLLQKPDMGAEWRSMFIAARAANITIRHLPLLGHFLMNLPDWITASISEPIAFLLKYEAVSISRALSLLLADTTRISEHKSRKLLLTQRVAVRDTERYSKNFEMGICHAKRKL